MCQGFVLGGLFHCRSLAFPRFKYLDSQRRVESDADRDSGFVRVDGGFGSDIGIAEFTRELVGDLAVKGASLKGGVIAGEQVRS